MAHTPEEEPKSLPREEELEDLAKILFQLPPDAVETEDLEAG